ncbi:hypothetical protein A9Q99_22820 [Gammaproteobacteria bacterium 45_16_T64]|nr:hypothetical protein A9Q99_22820 [Gammaproteobacteria bacterium 45_16_T64]
MIVVKHALPDIVVTHRVLKQEEYSRITVADSIIQEARLSAEKIISASKLEAERAIKQGYRTGLEQAQKKTAERLMTAKIRSNQMIAMAETDLVSLVKLTFERLFGELSDEQKLQGMIQAGLESMREDYRVSVHVAPSMEQVIRHKLADMVGALSGVECFDVIPDATLVDDECVLEGDGGLIRLSVSDQLTKLNDVVKAALVEPEEYKEQN